MSARQADWEDYVRTGRPRIFGVLNVTPDSFSDGGEHATVEAAVAHAHALIADGADWIDVGGESTAPGRAPLTPEAEQERIITVIRELAAAGVRLSVDTYHAATARAAVEAGALIVNDVYGSDPDMPAVLRETEAEYILMHSFGAPTTPHDYGNVVAEVAEELHRRVGALDAAGVDASRIVVDPGLGFSKQPAENWALINDLDTLGVETGCRVLVGASRKRFVKALVGEDRHALDIATAVIGLTAADRGVWAVRVHDVQAMHAAFATRSEVGRWSGVNAVAGPMRGTSVTALTRGGAPA